MDVKSITLWALVEQMGLAWPERYVWALHDEYLAPGPPPGVCPDDEYYEVVQRNFSVDASLVLPLQNNPYVNTIYSPYVNDTLYTFNILVFCPAGTRITVFNSLRRSVPVDPFADAWTSVAGDGQKLLSGSSGSLPGTFYTGLTRDDVAGLRYLMTSNNIATLRRRRQGALLQTTNLGPHIITHQLPICTRCCSARKPMTPANIPGLFPGVVVGTSSNYSAVVCTVTTNAIMPSQAYGAPYRQ